MSSRLIILPKKSYCPWKPENVQRVLRDQEQHRRETDDATQADERRARREALSQQHEQRLRRNRGDAGGTSDEAGGVAGSVRHINLFEAEEKVERARLTEHERGTMQEDGAPTAGAPPSANREGGRARGPFYLQENPYTSTSATLQQRSEAFVAREERRKAELDPMAAYSSSVKRRRTDDDDAGSAPTSTALVVRPRTNRRDQDEVASTSSESESDRRHRRKGKKRKKKKKHRRSREERERGRGASDDK
jgi:hypothetical protein